MPRAFNVLEGTVRGVIMVDDRAARSWALVRDSTYGRLYLGGQFDVVLLTTLIDHFRTKGAFGVSCWPDDRLNNILPPDPDYDGATLYFTEHSSDSVFASLSHVPSPYTLVQRDERWFAQSFDYDAALISLGSVANVMRLTCGTMVLDDDIVVCEAATSVATHGRIEAGVMTAEAHRQRGLATIACARLIGMCEAQGYATWWDCAKKNDASVRLARKLGYRNESEYRYRLWNQR
jgi:RimJ/RimL family protein N-acetyltransferase